MKLSKLGPNSNLGPTEVVKVGTKGVVQKKSRFIFLNKPARATIDSLKEDEVEKLPANLTAFTLKIPANALAQNKSQTLLKVILINILKRRYVSFVFTKFLRIMEFKIIFLKN